MSHLGPLTALKGLIIYAFFILKFRLSGKIAAYQSSLRSINWRWINELMICPPSLLTSAVSHGPTWDEPGPHKWLHARIWSLRKKTSWCQKECEALEANAVLTTGCLRLDQIKPKINTLGDPRRNLNLAFKFWCAHTHTHTETCKNWDPPSRPRWVSRRVAASRARCDRRQLYRLVQAERKTAREGELVTQPEPHERRVESLPLADRAGPRLSHNCRHGRDTASISPWGSHASLPPPPPAAAAAMCHLLLRTDGSGESLL